MTTEAQTPATAEANSQQPGAAPVAAPLDASTQAPAPAPAATAQTPAEAATPAAQAPAPEANTETPTGAPESYTDFTAPEGTTLNEDAMTEFKALAKERNLSQEDAQKFVDIGAKAVQLNNNRILEAVESTQAQWLADAKADKEFGGDKLGESLAVAKLARDTYGSEGLIKFLDESKLGNHPEMIRFFARIGRTIKPDSAVPGGTKPPGPSAGQNLYSKSNMNP
ncbi:hypothetical protein [Propionivibrio dicarboxylicus]|uniref:Uncharacterized protein n=1 Tax=Propionivibrio dicarboxylicus TaxID=83767 RepID=A0A1G8AQC0_9RHOO|nr:hypothetical protein [Propionivibrio dicarboxylicus]SDH23109.1 hypothetical protein SAMN05660652_01461 [Propionivibrio dicarboxylicus]